MNFEPIVEDTNVDKKYKIESFLTDENYHSYLSMTCIDSPPPEGTFDWLAYTYTVAP